MNAWFEANPVGKYLLSLLGVALLAIVAYYLTRRFLIAAIRYVAKKTSFAWDDAIVERGVFDKLAWLSPALVVYYFAYLFPNAGVFIQRGIYSYVLIILLLATSNFLTALNDIYNTYEFAPGRSIKGYVQVTKMLLWIFTGITMLAILFDKSPMVFVSGLGAMTAVLLLIFKDTILSFVASIQIATNDMIRVGDWIEMPKYGADGDVIDIALHTVKVQNWDKTITTIPTHRLIEDSFKNWRGMAEAGGRRIKRSLLIDQSSVRFCDDAMLERLAKIQVLTEYLQDKQSEIAEFNASENVSGDSEVNRRHLTNLGTFRVYVERFLQVHPELRKDLTLIVRQLQATTEGLPIELYCFCGDTRWAVFEGVQADIFDHLLAVIGEFDLRIFQAPSGADFGRLSSTSDRGS